jgi:hypothetical protein
LFLIPSPQSFLAFTHLPGGPVSSSLFSWREQTEQSQALDQTFYILDQWPDSKERPHPRQCLLSKKYNLSTKIDYLYSYHHLKRKNPVKSTAAMKEKPFRENPWTLVHHALDGTFLNKYVLYFLIIALIIIHDCFIMARGKVNKDNPQKERSQPKTAYRNALPAPPSNSCRRSFRIPTAGPSLSCLSNPYAYRIAPAIARTHLG